MKANPTKIQLLLFSYQPLASYLFVYLNLSQQKMQRVENTSQLKRLEKMQLKKHFKKQKLRMKLTTSMITGVITS